MALAVEVAAGRLAGAVLKVACNGQPMVDLALGRRDPAQPDPMPETAIFRICSMTKPLVSVAALMLMEEGLLQLADPLGDILPQFRDMKVVMSDGTIVPAARPIRLHDLLTHTSGLTYGARSSDPIIRAAHAGIAVNPRGMAPSSFLSQLAAAPLRWQPGTTWEYGFSTDVLGLAIEQITGMPLGAVLHERLFAPLGMGDTGFDLRADAKDRLAQPFARDPLSGERLACPAQTFDPAPPAALHSGGAGVLSTAADYLRFAAMLLAGGTLDGARVLSPASVRLMTSDHLGARIATPVPVGEAALQSPGYGFGLGVAVRLRRLLRQLVYAGI